MIAKSELHVLKRETFKFSNKLYEIIHSLSACLLWNAESAYILIQREDEKKNDTHRKKEWTKKQRSE